MRVPEIEDLVGATIREVLTNDRGGTDLVIEHGCSRWLLRPADPYIELEVLTAP